MREKLKGTETYCWVNTEEGILSFHYEEGYERKDFSSREEMMIFCVSAINSGYRVQ